MDIDALESTMSEEADMLEEIRSNIHRHTAPSVQLAKGKSKSTLGHKFHAITHALRLLAADLLTLAKMFTSIPVWLTDQGTECLIARIEKVPLLDLVPPSGIENLPYCEDEDNLAPRIASPTYDVGIADEDFAQPAKSQHDEAARISESECFADLSVISVIPLDRT